MPRHLPLFTSRLSRVRHGRSFSSGLSAVSLGVHFALEAGGRLNCLTFRSTLYLVISDFNNQKSYCLVFPVWLMKSANFLGKLTTGPMQIDARPMVVWQVYRQ